MCRNHKDVKISRALVRFVYSYLYNINFGRFAGLAQTHASRPPRQNVAAASAHAVGELGRDAEREEEGSRAVSGI